MGIDVQGVRFLAYASATGVDLSKTATIGRQGLYVTHRQMRGVLESFGWTVSESEITGICDGTGGYSDALLKYLGAREAHSFDYSDYQEPTYTHDMNEPIPEKFKEQYTAVLDGGSLEHIFNFPVAIGNCMEMIMVGGHYLAITPANNFFGHGFYQFSPELYFTVFSEENGFEITNVIAFEVKAKSVWYAVKNPREVGGRVTLSNDRPVYLLVIAKKVARVPIFDRAPQQSDYEVIWEASQPGKTATADGDPLPATARPLPIRIAKLILPFGLRRLIRKTLERSAREPVGFDPRFFQRMDRQFSAARSTPSGPSAAKTIPFGLVK